jgi:TolA-binding protein
MKKQKIIFLFLLFSSAVNANDNVEVDLLFLKIQELEIEIAELRNQLESQNYLIQKLIQESASNIENEDNIDALASDNTVRLSGVDDAKSE